MGSYKIHQKWKQNWHKDAKITKFPQVEPKRNTWKFAWRLLLQISAQGHHSSFPFHRDFVMSCPGFFPTKDPIWTIGWNPKALYIQNSKPITFRGLMGENLFPLKLTRDPLGWCSILTSQQVQSHVQMSLRNMNQMNRWLLLITNDEVKKFLLWCNIFSGKPLVELINYICSRKKFYETC